jgi:hypothetical protein
MALIANIEFRTRRGPENDAAQRAGVECEQRV